MKIYLIRVVIVTACLLVACSKDEVNNSMETSVTVELSPTETEVTITEAPNAVSKKTYTEVEWVDLIPDDDLQALENPPAYLDEIEDGSAEDRLTSQLKNQSSPAENRYQQALTSEKIRPEFNGRRVRIPGFIVALEYNDQQTVTSFFLVPFFGACLHMPPPPPNQIIYAEFEPGIRLNAFYDPYWIEGTLSTTLIENEVATAAYTISVSSVEPYVEDGNVQAEEEAAP